MLSNKIRDLNDALNKIVNDYGLIHGTHDSCPVSAKHYQKQSLATELYSIEMSISNAEKEHDLYK